MAAPPAQRRSATTGSGQRAKASASGSGPREPATPRGQRASLGSRPGPAPRAAASRPGTETGSGQQIEPGHEPGQPHKPGGTKTGQRPAGQGRRRSGPRACAHGQASGGQGDGGQGQRRRPDRSTAAPAATAAKARTGPRALACGKRNPVGVSSRTRARWPQKKFFSPPLGGEFGPKKRHFRHGPRFCAKLMPSPRAAATTADRQRQGRRKGHKP